MSFIQDSGSTVPKNSMKVPKINKQEWPVMDALWSGQIMSITEIRAWICDRGSRTNYAKVQTMVYGLEARGAVRRVTKYVPFTS